MSGTPSNESKPVAKKEKPTSMSFNDDSVLYSCFLFISLGWRHSRFEERSYWHQVQIWKSSVCLFFGISFISYRIQKKPVSSWSFMLMLSFYSRRVDWSWRHQREKSQRKNSIERFEWMKMVWSFLLSKDNHNIIAEQKQDEPMDGTTSNINMKNIVNDIFHHPPENSNNHVHHKHEITKESILQDTQD